MKLTTTLNRIRECSPCDSGWRTLLKSLPSDFDRDAPIDLLHVLESNGYADCIWCFRAADGGAVAAAELACGLAESVLPVFEAAFPDDDRPRKAVEAARAARAVYAADAAEAARAAYAAARAAVYAADAAEAARAAYAAAYAAEAVYAAYAADAAEAVYAAYAAAEAAEAADAAGSDVVGVVRQFLAPY